MKLALTVGAFLALGAIAVWLYASHQLRQVYLADIPFEAFRAIEERTIRNAFEPHETHTREILFAPPDSWSTRCDDCPFCSTVIIEDKAWNYTGGGGGWREVFPDRSLLGTALYVFDRPVRQHQIEDLGEGHVVAGERTRWVGAIDADYGSRVADQVESHDGSETVRRTNDGASLSIQILYGQESDRVYEVIVTFAGPNMFDRTRLTFEYDVDVEILPPDLSEFAVAP